MADLTLEQALAISGYYAKVRTLGPHAAHQVMAVLAAAVRAQQARTCETCMHKTREYLDECFNPHFGREYGPTPSVIKFCGLWESKQEA